jgi:hypothetical protein
LEKINIKIGINNNQRQFKKEEKRKDMRNEINSG